MRIDFQYIWRFAAVAIISAGLRAGADDITVNGREYRDVLIREGASRYYVQIPEDGSLFSIDKKEVKDVVVSEEESDRNALLRQWKENRGESDSETSDFKAAAPPDIETAKNSLPPAVEAALIKLPSADRKRMEETLSRGEAVSDGMVSYVKLEEVALGDALKAVLRTCNLDYKIVGSYIFISAPEILEKEPFEALETRYYRLKGASEETLPKIVIRQQFSVTGTGYGSGSYSNNRNPNRSASPYGSAWGSGSGGGYGGNRYGNGGYGGGGSGNMGYGGGGYGGGGYYGGDVTQITNISDLFSTVDPRFVGETPEW